MTTILSNACCIRGCLHYRGPYGPSEDPVFVCYAYPKGIPEEVLVGDDLHQVSRGDDDGIVFEQGQELLEALKHLPGRHDQQTHTPHIYASGTPVTREWLRDGGSKLFEQLHHPVVRKMIEDTLVDYGVTQEELEGLSGFTTQPPTEHGYRMNPRGYYAYKGADEDVWGLYVPDTKMVCIPQVMAYRGEGPTTVLHEIGHHVARSKSFIDAELGPGTGSVMEGLVGKDNRGLLRYGLRRYSLDNESEFLADNYLVFKAGSTEQKARLSRLWANATDYGTLEAVFKEQLVRVLEIVARERNGIIEFITMPVEVDQSIVDKVPWYYIKETSNNV